MYMIFLCSYFQKLHLISTFYFYTFFFYCFIYFFVITIFLYFAGHTI